MHIYTFDDNTDDWTSTGAGSPILRNHFHPRIDDPIYNRQPNTNLQSTTANKTAKLGTAMSAPRTTVIRTCSFTLTDARSPPNLPEKAEFSSASPPTLPIGEQMDEGMRHACHTYRKHQKAFETYHPKHGVPLSPPPYPMAPRRRPFP